MPEPPNKRLRRGLIDVQLSEMENPVAQMTDEQRRTFFKNLSEESAKRFEDSLAKINEILRKASPLEILSRLSFYDLLLCDQLGTRENTYLTVHQPHVELAQALCLSVPLTEVSAKPLQPPDQQALSDSLKTAMTSFSHKRLPEEQPGAEILSTEWMRIHTQLFRNRAHPEYTFTFYEELFTPLDDRMIAASGLTLSGVLRMIHTLIKEIEKSLCSQVNIHLQIFRSKTISEAIAISGDTQEDQGKLSEFVSEKGFGLEHVKALSFAYQGHCLSECFTFTVADAVEAYGSSISHQKVQWILDKLSLAPGALTNEKQEHFFLGNPIWSKPFIKVGKESYFWPIPQTFVTSGIEMLEGLIDEFPYVKEYYEQDVRASYLENKAEALFAQALPGCLTYRGSLWSDPQTGTQWENDLAVLLDTFLIVVESKSGAIPPSARRGGKRLQHAVKELIQTPAEQSTRFVEFLLKNRKVHCFETKRGVSNTIDTTNVRRVVRISLTLESFGPLTCQARLLSEGGFLPHGFDASVTIPYLALKTCFFYLQSPHEKLHYLCRRSSWEANVHFLADEYDLLTFYLGSGFNVGALEFQERNLILYGLGDRLDDYSRAVAFGFPCEKPGLKMTSWWRAILKQTAERRFPGWTDAGIFLLSLDASEQWQIEKSIERLKKGFRRGFRGKGAQNSLILISERQGNPAVGAYVFDTQNRFGLEADLNSMVSTARERGATEVLIIGVDAFGKHYPYSFLRVAA